MSAEPRGPWGTTRADERRYGYPPPRCRRSDPHRCELGAHSVRGAYLPDPAPRPAPRLRGVPDYPRAIPHPVTAPEPAPVAWCPTCRGWHRPIRGLR